MCLTLAIYTSIQYECIQTIFSQNNFNKCNRLTKSIYFMEKYRFHNSFVHNSIWYDARWRPYKCGGYVLCTCVLFVCVCVCAIKFAVLGYVHCQGLMLYMMAKRRRIYGLIFKMGKWNGTYTGCQHNNIYKIEKRGKLCEFIENERGKKNKYQEKEIISSRRLKPFSLISKQLARLKCLFRVHRPFDRYNCAILIVWKCFDFHSSCFATNALDGNSLFIWCSFNLVYLLPPLSLCFMKSRKIEAKRSICLHVYTNLWATAWE